MMNRKKYFKKNLVRSPQGHRKVTARCDLEMTFKEFIEIEPNKLGHKGLLTYRSQRWYSFRYQGHQKVTVWCRGHGVTLK